MQSGGGERFCLSITSQNVDGGNVLTTQYCASVFDGKYSSAVTLVPFNNYISFLINLRRILIQEWKNGSNIQTSGTWNHVIDVYLALIGSKVKYDCWIWGSMFQFAPTVEKLKYAFIFKNKINKILKLNRAYTDHFINYQYKNWNEYFKYNLIALLKFLAVRKSNRVYCLSNLNQKEISILYNRKAIVDFAIFDAIAQPSRSIDNLQNKTILQVFTVGRLAENKNIDKLVLAFNKILEAGIDARFHIVGTGPEAKKLENMVSSLGITRKVIFHGYLSDTELENFFDRNAIFWCFDNADFNLAPLLFASREYKVICASPFQKNKFTESCQNFHICCRSIDSLVEKTIEIRSDAVISYNRESLSEFTWSSLAERLSSK